MVHRVLWAVLFTTLTSGCFDLQLPGPPGPGSVQGRLVYQLPGQRLLLPASGATVELLASSLTTQSNEDGRFVLGGLHRSDGVLLVRFDLEGDGRFERQLALDLRRLRAGPGLDVALGEIVLNRNASARGTVRRGDLSGPGGHGGISIFVPELGFQTLSGDNGDWLLEELPEGGLPIAFFAPGYEPQSLELTSTSGNLGQLPDVTLERALTTGAASATGVVSELSGELLEGVTVRAAGVGPERTTTSDAQGEITFSALPPGVYSFAYEKTGFETAAVLSVLLVPGANPLREIALSPGTSQPFLFEFPDAGPLEPVDGGMAACQGQCGTGFSCTDSGACRASGCENQSCALCSNGRCLTEQCTSGPTCRPGEVCEGGACVPFECAGQTCPGGRCVAGGGCLPSTCPNVSCAPGLVCQAGGCIHPRCVGKVCATGTLCAQGSCLPTSGVIDRCGPLFVRRDGRCVEAVCQGAACAPGASCRSGTCVAEGLFVAGIVGPRADLNQYESLLAANVNGAWTRLNVTALPKVRQLAVSLDGSWLFAVGEDDSLRRSQDGVTWQTVWSGTAVSGGLMKAIAVFPNGDLYAAVNGAYQSGLTRVIASTDDGASWSTVAGPVGGFNGTPDLTSIAPPGLMSFFNPNQSAPSRAVQSFDGGVFMDNLGTPGKLLFDPTDFGPTFVAETNLRFLDGGVAGPVSTGLGAIVYAEAPRTFIWAASSQAIWKSPDHGVSWGSRSTATPLALDLTSLVQGVDGTLYAGNRKATPSLLASVDDGDTWLPAAAELTRNPTLSDRYDTWQPDASYGYQSTVIPTVPNGLFYERGPGTSRTTVEPNWAIDGGVTTDPEGLPWRALPVLSLRVSAMVSRSCSVGELRCAGACVDVIADVANCGACGNACPGPAACVRGACESLAQVASLAGCADGTREGFVDLETSPSIAACAGNFTGELTGSGPDALCAAGWHVCRHDDPVALAVSYLAATGFPGCFAMRASTDDGDGCEPLDCSDSTRDDIAGMGAGCAQLSGVSRVPASVPAVGGCLADQGIIDTQCCAIALAGAGCPQRGESGVLCCQGP